MFDFVRFHKYKFSKKKICKYFAEFKQNSDDPEGSERQKRETFKKVRFPILNLI